MDRVDMTEGNSQAFFRHPSKLLVRFMLSNAVGFRKIKKILLKKKLTLIIVPSIGIPFLLSLSCDT